jgi:hypothetical protein
MAPCHLSAARAALAEASSSAFAADAHPQPTTRGLLGLVLLAVVVMGSFLLLRMVGRWWLRGCADDPGPVRNAAGRARAEER